MTRHEFLTQLAALAGRVPEGDFHVVLGDLRRYLPATSEGPPLDYRGATATDVAIPWSPGDLRILAASLGWPAIQLYGREWPGGEDAWTAMLADADEADRHELHGVLAEVAKAANA